MIEGTQRPVPVWMQAKSQRDGRPLFNASWRGVNEIVRKKVIIAEDQRILRDGLKVLLSEMDYLDIVGEAEDGSGAIRAVERLRPDLVLMELSMPRVSGLTALTEIKRRFPETKVLVLTIHRSQDYIFEAFRSGADGYCLKDSSFEELDRAIRCVLSGKPYFSTGISDRILEGYLKGAQASRGETPQVHGLTQREKEILKLLGENRKNREIAELLFISVKTVEKHRSNIMRKLNCHTASALASFSKQNGLAVKHSD
jgi:DNA-binding NarL/FixJ family response regulator